MSSAQTKSSAGWTLITAPIAMRPERTGWSSQRQPSGEQEQQDRPDLAELDRIERTARRARPAARSPAHPAETGRIATPATNAATSRPVQAQSPAGSTAGRTAGRRARTAADRGRSRSRRAPRHSGRRAAGRRADAGPLRVGQEVEPERLAGASTGSAPTSEAKTHDRDDRAAPAEPAPRSVGAASGRAGPGGRRRWISGIRNRSHATRSARPGRARIREPRRSSQWIGTIAIR